MPYVPGVSRSGAATIAPVPSMFRFASYFSYITCQCSGLPSSPVIIIHLINLVGESGIRCCPVEDIPGTWIRRRLLQIGSEIIDLYLQSRSASGTFRPGRFHKSTMVFLWSGFGPFQRAPNSSPGRFMGVVRYCKIQEDLVKSQIMFHYNQRVCVDKASALIVY